MKAKWILAAMCLMMSTWLWADENITVTATSSDVSENLNLRTVATLFGQAKDLEEFEALLNNPDSAYSNLDLNGDGDVDYLRVVETADGSKHLVVIQAVLAKDIYQDVASIFVDKDEEETVTIQVVGDEYVYGTNYIIEPVYLYRPLIYDWFWGASWVAWHSPYYWDYYPHWWHRHHCIDPFLYWDHCYWHHYHHPICSYRTAHHHHPHFHSMHHAVRRNDMAVRHPERSFATRNASRSVQNARALEIGRRTEMRKSGAIAPSRSAAVGGSSSSTTRVAGTVTRSNTYGSTNVRAAGTATRSTTAGTVRTAGTATRSTTAGTAVRTTGTTSTTRSVSTAATRGSSPSVSRSSSSSPSVSRSSSVSTSATRSTSSPAVRSSSSSVSRSSGYSGSSTRSSGYSSSGSSSSRSAGSVRR